MPELPHKPVFDAPLSIDKLRQEVDNGSRFIVFVFCSGSSYHAFFAGDTNSPEFASTVELIKRPTVQAVLQAGVI